MRKRILEPNTAEFPSTGPDWLDRERLTRVELSSEDPAHPAEAAVIPGDTRGWRAAHSGEQTIRLLFDERLDLRHIRQVSTETEHERTRELDLEVVEEWRPDISSITSAHRIRCVSVKSVLSDSRASARSNCISYWTSAGDRHARHRSR